jgi:hypothetical protein
MAEYGSLAAGEHRRHPFLACRQRSMAEGVDLAMDPIQTSAGEPVLNRSGPEARGEQLAPGDHAVLAIGYPRDRQTWVVWCMHAID